MIDKADIKGIIYNLIVNRPGTEEERKLHTQKLTKCLEDIESQEYLKALIRGHLKDEIDLIDENFVNEIFSDHWGLGILDKYDTDDIDEIIVLGKEIILKKKGKKIRVQEKFNDYKEVISIMRRCIEFNKEKDLNDTNAIKSSVRADGARIQIVIPPVSEYPILNIRKFGYAPTTENMLRYGTFTQKHVDILSTLVKGRANILIIGATETGKTTTLKWLTSFLDDDLMIGTVETDFELNIKKDYPNKLIVPLQERENYLMSTLLPVTLRQSVDLVIVGEVRRSYEAIEFANASTRGHSGSMTSFHDFSATGAINSLASLVMQNGLNMDFNSIKFLFANAVNIVVKMKKLPKNKEGKEKKVCEGIYEIVTNSEDMTFKEVPIMKLKIDEEDPINSIEQQFINSISEKLKFKLNEYGVKMSEINSCFNKE